MRHNSQTLQDRWRGIGAQALGAEALGAGPLGGHALGLDSDGDVSVVTILFWKVDETSSKGIRPHYLS
jgi:hypothetical protein